MSQSSWWKCGLAVALTASATAFTAPAATAAGQLAYSSTVTIPGTTEAAGAVAIGDFNGDSIDDHAISTPNLVTVLLGARGAADGGGSVKLTAVGSTFVGSGGGISVSPAGDVDGDGFDDLVLAPTIGSTTAFIVYGAANTTAPVSIQSGARVTAISTGSWGPQAPHAVGIGDFNGDGLDDIIVPSKSGTSTLNGTSSTAIVAGGPRVATLSTVATSARVSLVVSLRSCSQRYSLAWPYVTTVCRTRDPDLVPIGDFNDDGKDDLYLNGKEGASQAILLGRSGSGLSISAVNPGAGSVSLTGIAADAGVAGFWDSVRAVGDVNGDQFDDFLLPIQGRLGANVAVVAGRANPPTSLPSTSGLYFVDGVPLGPAGEQTGDGRADLIVARDAKLAVASLPAGASSFAASTQTWIEGFPPEYGSPQGRPTTGDLDGDGATDVLLGAFRLTHSGSPAPTIQLEARTVVLGPADVLIGGQESTITAACAGGNAETKTVQNNAPAFFDGGASLAIGDRCTVSSTTNLLTQPPFDSCRWTTSLTYRGATILEGTTVTLGTGTNAWVKTIKCLPALNETYPTNLQGWGLRGSASPTFDANNGIALTSSLSHTGSAVWPTPLSWDNKAIEFTLSMNAGNGAAEGVTMAFLNDAGGEPVGGYLGAGGGQLGFGGLGGIALAFDAFKQPEDAQPNTVNWVDGPQGASLRKLYSKDAGLRLRGTPIKVRVVVKDGKLTATLNGKFVHSVAATLPAKAYLAFTGSTSAAIWQTQTITGLKITDA